MRRPRLSTARALALVGYVAALLAALRSGSDLWFKTIYSATFLVLLYAGLAARHRGPFWYGFAVVGWAYFLVGYGPWIEGSSEISWAGAINPGLLSEILTDKVLDWSHRMSSDRAITGSFGAVAIPRLNRAGVCHSALTLAFACLGGLASGRMAGRSEGRGPTI